MFLTRDERRGSEREAREQPGLKVVLADGKRYWFPGSTPELATAMARMAVPPDLMDHPDTTAEFGVCHGSLFVPEKVIKAPQPKTKPEMKPPGI
jgi:hypothetical protein